MDDFKCRAQEIHDPNTGVTVTFGRHNENGRPWMRLASLMVEQGKAAAGDTTKTTTVIFDMNGDAVSLTPHKPAPAEQEKMSDEVTTSAPTPDPWPAPDPQQVPMSYEDQIEDAGDKISEREEIEEKEDLRKKGKRSNK
jgi:hypothetical protein